MLLNPYRFGTPGGAITLDPATAAANISLSNGNKTAQRINTGTAAACAQTTVGRGVGAGKRAFEFYIDLRNDAQSAVGLSIAFNGIGTSDKATDLGQETGEFGYRAGGNSYIAGAFNTFSGATWTTNDLILVCVDFDNKLIWWLKNGTAITGNPAAGTGGTSYSHSVDMFPTLQVNGTSQFTIRTTAAEIVTSLPSGFSAYE